MRKSILLSITLCLCIAIKAQDKPAANAGQAGTGQAPTDFAGTSVDSLTGWYVGKFAALEATVVDLMNTFGEEYTDGAILLSEIASKKALHGSLRINRVSETIR